MEMTGKSTSQFFERASSVSATALYTIVVYHHLSGSSSNIRNGEDRKSDTSICQNDVKCFSGSSINDCCIINCQDLHWLFEIEMTGGAIPQFVETAWSVSVTALYTIVVYHHLSGSSANFWNGDDSRSDPQILWKGVKRLSNSFKDDCCISSTIRIFIEYWKWR